MKYIEVIKGKVIYITVLYSLCFFLFSAGLFQDSDFVNYVLPQYLIIVYFIWFIICLYFVLYARLRDKLILLVLFTFLFFLGIAPGYVPSYERGPGQMESLIKGAFLGSSTLSSGIWSIYYVVSHLISRVKTKQQA
jgi:hypothetical protein